MSRDRERQQSQLAFVASGNDIEVGDRGRLPLPADVLKNLRGDENFVVARLEGGLTAEVWRLKAAGREWTLKRARARCLVQNVDGQTSFLNEIQRRADIAALKALPGGRERFAGCVDTVWGCFREGLLLSPWIDGGAVADWDERRLVQLFALLEELILAGLFEWDLCPGNLLDDGAIRMFDFGYMYRFDPLTEFNSNGREAPLFHAAERFETRNYFAWLLELEFSAGIAAALAAFALEKRVAGACYERLVSRLAARGAAPEVLSWLRGFLDVWGKAQGETLADLYLAEGWRSHRLDLDDDLRGKTCTKRTLARCDWLIAAAREHFAALTGLDALFWHDEGLGREALIARLEADRARAERFQIK
ncbi:hypothetical protein [Niveibacterium terrae]|uniref:hypothetical protein n=1 Tax=Niveibacterium terrae TaxID=3373598 RepID=UPI003A9315D1